MLKRLLAYARGFSKLGLFAGLSEDMKEYGKEISQDQKENIVNVMTNEFPAGSGKKTYSQCVFIEEDAADYKPTESFMEMLKNDDFYNILKELVEFGISRYERDYSDCYENSDLVLYQMGCPLGFPNDWGYYWFPTTYCYHRHKQSLWRRMKSREFCQRIQPLFGVSTIEELKEKVKNSPLDMKMHYDNEFGSRALGIRDSISVEEIGSLN